MIEKMLNIKLNKKQKAYASAVRWFYRDAPRNRATGRTTLGLVLIIEKALQNPGKEVSVFDHHGMEFGIMRMTKVHLMARINQMLQKSNVLPHRISIDYNNGTLKIT